MNIHIPKGFVYETKSGGYAYEKNGRLYVRKIGVEALMRELTYVLKGRNRCYYCGCVLTSKNRTIDHMFPRNWGGITIPDNLVPCCMRCNNRKGNLTAEQYKKWLTLPDNAKKDFRTKSIQENERFVEHGKLLLNPKWIDYANVAELSKRFSADRRKRFVNNNKKVKSTDVIYLCNQGKWVPKGLDVLDDAVKGKRKTVPVIRLSNVTYNH